MLKTILLCVALILSGAAIGASITSIVFANMMNKEYSKYIAVLRWICDIPKQCWHDEEFDKHVNKLLAIVRSEDEPDEKTV